MKFRERFNHRFIKKNLSKVRQWLQARFEWLMQPKIRIYPDRPSKLAHHLDHYGGRIVFLVVSLLLLLQFGFSLVIALLAAIGLTLGLHFSLKKGRPRLILRRFRSNNRGDEGHSNPTETTANRRSGRWRGQVITGLGLLGIGWLWSGGWGLYFTILGLINLILAVIVVLGERKREIITGTQP